MQTTPVEQAIALLQNTQKQLYELLQPFSGLYLRTDHLLTVLINGLIFTTKQTGFADTQSNFNPSPMTFTHEEQHTLHSPTTTPEPLITIEHEAIDKLRQKAGELYHNFCKRESKDILEVCNALEIRAVAKLAGINPMDHPEQIDHAFVNTIKQAIHKKETEQKAVDDWLAKEEKASTLPPTTPSPVTQHKPAQSSKKTNTKK